MCSGVVDDDFNSYQIISIFRRLEIDLHYSFIWRYFFDPIGTEESDVRSFTPKGILQSTARKPFKAKQKQILRRRYERKSGERERE